MNLELRPEMGQAMRLDMEFGFKALVALIAAVWGGLTPLMQALMGLMVLDMATGVLAGYVARELSSDVSFRGVAKKAIVLLVVGAAWLLEHQAGVPIPLADAVAGFYLASELISVLENTSRAGLPVPQVLQDALSKLKRSS